MLELFMESQNHSRLEKTFETHNAKLNPPPPMVTAHTPQHHIPMVLG